MGNFENIVVFIHLLVHLYKIGFIQNIEITFVSKPITTGTKYLRETYRKVIIFIKKINE